MEFFTDWWGGLNFTLQIFYGAGLISGAILLLQTLLMLFGIGDMDGDFDLDHGDGGGHILSIRTVTAFFFGFGWTGAICVKSGMSIGLALLIAVAVGSAMVLAILAIMRLISGLRQDGSINYKNAIGEIATVYLPIPAGGEKPGQVEVLVQGRLVVVEAYCRAEQKIGNQSKVKVIDTIGERSLLVEPLI